MSYVVPRLPRSIQREAEGKGATPSSIAQQQLLQMQRAQQTQQDKNPSVVQLSARAQAEVRSHLQLAQNQPSLQVSPQAVTDSLAANYTISDDRSNSSRHSYDLLLALQDQSRTAEVFPAQAGPARDNAAAESDTDYRPRSPIKLSEYATRDSTIKEPFPPSLVAPRPRGSISSSEEVGNHRLQDYQMQLMLLEQQNKKRLMIARQEQDSIGMENQARIVKAEEEAARLRQERSRARQVQLAWSAPSPGPRLAASEVFQSGGLVKSQDSSSLKGKAALRTSAGAGNDCGRYRRRSPGSPGLPVQNGHVGGTDVDRERGCSTAPMVKDIDPEDFSSLNISDFNIIMTSHMEALPKTKASQFSSDIVLDTDCSKEAVTLGAVQLQGYVRYLEEQQQKLLLVEAENNTLRATKEPTLRPRWQVLYRLPDEGDEMYFDHPRLVAGEQGTKSLRCSMPLSNFDLHLEKNKDIAFIVFKDFKQIRERSRANDIALKSEQNPGARIEPFQESIRPVSEELMAAVEDLLSSDSIFSMFENHYEETTEIAAPYLCIYHTRDLYDPVFHGVQQENPDHFDLMRQYVDEVFGDEYSLVDDMLSRGVINRQLIKYLFKPGQLVLSRENCSEAAYMTTSWPNFVVSEGPPKGLRAVDFTPSEEADDSKICSFEGWSWQFHGSFEQKNATFVLKVPKSDPSELCVTDLNIYPFEFASKSLQERLERRGQILWSCRFRRFVSYQSEQTVGDAQEVEEERYIIDLETYKKLHHLSLVSLTGRDDLGAERMNSSDTPSRDFLVLLPSEVKGFNLREKKWHDLTVDRIRDVPWNKKAFDSLVLPDKTKKIIRALVTKQIAAEKSTDLIQGKGNGLIILLHGGPGTGKTLTAESIAEMTEKPLYRVTCGDLGTKPEEVEKYMESVLHLGKIWDCVVLLDEADVFLQERNLRDLQRNALVSVFLRVLEYHEGILFLTSNRIGTFDEAFKSRIQLSLHYKALGLPERKKVWRNFIKHLGDLKEEKNIDFDDLRDNIEKLAAEELNGRQIRNAITIARQLAQFDEKMLNHEHLEDVIKIAADFDEFVKGINENMSDEDRMRELQLR